MARNTKQKLDGGTKFIPIYTVKEKIHRKAIGTAVLLLQAEVLSRLEKVK